MRKSLLAVILLPLIMGIPCGEASSINCYDYREVFKYLPPGWTMPEPPAAGVMGPPANPAVGETSDWYIWSLNGMPQSTLKPCTIRGEGPNVFVVVDDDVWNVRINQADVDIILENFENSSPGPVGTGIYDIDTTAFGSVPLGVDGNPKVYLLYYNFDVSSDGFFWAFDTALNPVPPVWPESNECEVIYLNCGTVGFDHDPSSSYMLGVAAHEFVHLIAYDKDPNESNWVDETMAEIGMALYGNWDDIGGFVANHNVTLTANNSRNWTVSYGARMLFGTYFWEKYGGDGTTLDLVSLTFRDDFGFDRALLNAGYSEKFEDLFKDWIVANYLNDSTVGDGRYGYDFLTYNPIPADRTEMSVPVTRTGQTVKIWAAKYILFRNLSDGSYAVSFDGVGNTSSSADHFYARLVSLDSTGTNQPAVGDIVLDTAMDGTALVAVDQTYDSFLLVVGAWRDAAVTSNPWDATFSYSVDLVTPIDLRVAKRSGQPPLDRDIHLTWTGGAGPFNVYRSDQGGTVIDPLNIIAPGTMALEYWDLGVPGVPRVHYYKVERQ